MTKESKYTKYLEWFIMLVLLFGILEVTREFGFAKNLKPDTRVGKYIMMVGIFLIGFIVLGAHELGHLITGLISGFRFELFVIGPLGIKRENDEIKVYFNKDLAYYGGVAGTSPVDDDKDNAKKFARILLAGPIASLLFAVVCFAGAYFAGKPLGIIFYTGGVISIAIFFVTTIPSRTGMFFTDRKRYQRLMTPGKDQQVELAILNIMGKLSKDNSFKNIDENDIRLLVSDELPLIKYFGLFNLVCYQLEMKGVVEEDIFKEYENISKKMSKKIVIAFDKEIEKFKERLKNERSTV